MKIEDRENLSKRHSKEHDEIRYGSRLLKRNQSGHYKLLQNSGINNPSLKLPIKNDRFHGSKPRNPPASKLSNNTSSKNIRRGPCFDKNDEENQVERTVIPTTIKLPPFMNDTSTQKSIIVKKGGITTNGFLLNYTGVVQSSRLQSTRKVPQDQNTENPLKHAIQLMPLGDQLQ